jgi:hypothetical protein
MARPRGGNAAVVARMRCAPGLSPRGYYALAGFFDAEGYFGISGSRGRTPVCSASIGLRDDDAEVVYRFSEATGLGHVRSVPARGGSRPQVRWDIGTKIECRALAGIFERYPLLGRKCSEVQMWSQAVERWCGPPGSDRTNALNTARDELQRLRKYNAKFDESSPAAVNHAHVLAHFGGFFSGDGSLSLDPNRRRAQVIVKLRRDDTPLLRTFQSSLGFGSLLPVAGNDDQKPLVVWYATARAELGKAIAVLDEAPLLGLKKRQYDVWRPAAAELASCGSAGQRPDGRILMAAREHLAELRRYKPPPQPYRTTRYNEGISSRTYIEVLHTWSRKQQGALSCVKYGEARRDHP